MAADSAPSTPFAEPLWRPGWLGRYHGGNLALIVLDQRGEDVHSGAETWPRIGTEGQLIRGAAVELSPTGTTEHGRVPAFDKPRERSAIGKMMFSLYDPPPEPSGIGAAIERLAQPGPLPAITAVIIADPNEPGYRFGQLIRAISPEGWASALRVR